MSRVSGRHGLGSGTTGSVWREGGRRRGVGPKRLPGLAASQPSSRGPARLLWRAWLAVRQVCRLQRGVQAAGVGQQPRPYERRGSHPTSAMTGRRSLSQTLPFGPSIPSPPTETSLPASFADSRALHSTFPIFPNRKRQFGARFLPDAALRSTPFLRCCPALRLPILSSRPVCPALSLLLLL